MVIITASYVLLSKVPVVTRKGLINFCSQEGLLSLYRGGPGDQATDQGRDTLDRFRNSVVDSVDLEDWHLDGARRLSITNAIDILRRHVLKAIKRKKDRHLVNKTVQIDSFCLVTSGGQC